MLLWFVINVSAATCGLLVAILLVHAIQMSFKNWRAKAEFQKKLRGVEMASGWLPLGGHIHKFSVHRRNWQNVAKSHQEHGDTFGWMSSTLPCVATLDLELIKTMTLDQADLHVNRTKYLGLPVDEMEFDEILVAEDDQWRRLRKNMAPAFSAHKMRAPNVQQEIKSTVDKFVTSLEYRIETSKQRDAKGNKLAVIDVEDILNRYILALVFTCFYKQDNLVNFYSDNDYWQRITEEGLRSMSGWGVYLTLVFPLIRPLVQFFLINFHVQGEMRLKVIGFITRLTRLNLEARKQMKDCDQLEREEGDADNLKLEDGSNFRRNMIDWVIDRFQEGNITPREYVHSTFLIFFAANKTTADGLSKFIYLLAKDLRVQEKLREAVLRDGIECEYMSWCLNEALRLFPPIHFGATRVAARDIETSDGKLIPQGTIVFTHNHTIHRLKKYWGDDAEEYKPERWANAKDFHPTQFLAFGSGKRNCLGKDFAQHAIKILTERLLREYKFEYVPGSNDDMMFEAPFFTFCCFDGPTNIRFSRL